MDYTEVITKETNIRDVRWDTDSMLNTRIRNGLQAAGLSTVNEVLKTPSRTLLKTKNMGKKCFTAISNTLTGLGFLTAVRKGAFGETATNTSNWEEILGHDIGRNKDEVEGKAKLVRSDTTTDYSKFCFHPQNRAIIRHKVKKIAESIARWGNCDTIKCRKSNRLFGKLEVYEGQHTLEACKLLGVPVNYNLFENVPLRAMIEINRLSTSWKTEDYLEYGVGEKLKDYLLMEEYVNSNKKPKPVRISSLICLLSGHQTSKTFKNLAWKATRPRFADRVLGYLHDFSNYIEHWHHTKFIWAMCRVVETGRYEHDVMMAKLEYASDKFINVSGVDAHMDVISKVYNYNNRAGKIVRFS